MSTLKVTIQDPEALASIRRSVIIDYLMDHNWRLVANMKTTKQYPKGESSLHISKTNPASPSIAVPADERLQDYAKSVAAIITTLSEIEQRSQLEIFDDLRDMAASPAGTYPNHGTAGCASTAGHGSGSRMQPASTSAPTRTTTWPHASRERNKFPN